LPDSARAAEEPSPFSAGEGDVYRSQQGSAAPKPFVVIDFASLSPAISLGSSTRIGGVVFEARDPASSLEVARVPTGAGLRITPSGLRIGLPAPGVPAELTGWFEDVTVTALALRDEVGRYEFPGPLRLARCRVAERGVTDLDVRGAGESRLVEVSIGETGDGEHA
jgi:hypothetical protein